MKQWQTAMTGALVGVLVGFGGGWSAGTKAAGQRATQEAMVPRAPASATTVSVVVSAAPSASTPAPSASAEGSDGGTLRPMKQQEAKAALAARVKPDDPVRSVGAKVESGPYNIGHQVTISVENTTKDKTITAFEGTAYGFTAFDDPTNLNARGFGMRILDNEANMAPGKKGGGSWQILSTAASTAIDQGAQGASARTRRLASRRSCGSPLHQAHALRPDPGRPLLAGRAQARPRRQVAGELARLGRVG